MAYIISYNKQKKDCKIHKSICNSIKQVIGDRESTNQIYSDVLNNCQDAKKYIINNNYQNYVCCQKCNPNCCDS